MPMTSLQMIKFLKKNGFKKGYGRCYFKTSWITIRNTFARRKTL